jgi:PAS domain S-box-containing protein
LKKFPTAGRQRWLAIGNYIVALLVAGVAYYALAKLGLRLVSVNSSAGPIWPATGVALAAVLLGGLRMWPAVLVGAFAAYASTGGTQESSAAIAFGNTLGAVVGGYLIGRWSNGAMTFTTAGRVAKFALVCVGPTTVISATIGVATLCQAGLAQWTNFAPAWVTWWLGDTVGALTVTPVIVLWAQTNWRALDRREFFAVVAVLASAVVIGLIAFSPLLPRSEYSSPLGFLAILPLVWATLRRGPRDTATISLIVAGFAVWATVKNIGPFELSSSNESFLMLLAIMISLSLPSLALSANVEMHRRTEERLCRTQSDLDMRVRQRTAALADANIHLQEAQRLANLGSWSWDIEQDRVTLSDQLYDIYGISRGCFRGTVKEFLSYVHPDDRTRVEASIGNALNGRREITHEERIVRPDGGVRNVLSIGEVVRNEKGAPVRMLGVCLDVTERKNAERALRRSEQNYRLLLKGVRDYAIYMLDVDGRVRSWNEGAARIKGYSADEIIGRHFRVFLPEEVRATDLADDALVSAAGEGQYEAQMWLMRKDGSYFFASVIMDAIRSDTGELIGFAQLVRDITSQHEAQVALEEAKDQLTQAQKMEALGQLTGGIAHDFNNLLMIVSGYAQILQSRLNDAKDKQAVEAIRAAAGRGERLTRQLLAFSRRQQLMPVTVDLRLHIDAVRDMLAPSLRGNIELICYIEDKIWPIDVDLGELELALVNIAVNARDAMPDGGTITLSARNVVLKPGSAAGALAGDFVALAMIDTGGGMPPDVLARVFEPFYTTKPVGKGTGLGLSQVHGFAIQSGGAATVTSEVGKGTAVTIYLPRSRAEPLTHVDGQMLAPDQARGTVLLVEDSREVAELTSMLFEQLGFRVVRAENATEALRHLQQGIHFDLVFSDIVMPGPMNGLDLAEACRDRFPDLPVLLTSGYSEAAQLADGRFEILRKPFELSVLERAVETVLGEMRSDARARAV